jgi:uncharacterized coiled-coil DUF342 family protein
MTNKDYENISHSLAKIYEIVSKYNFSMDEFYGSLIHLITNFQKYDQEIYSSFFIAKIRCKERVQQFTNKINNYKGKKAVTIQLLRDLIKQKEDLSKPKPETNITKLIENLKRSIQDIEYKIFVLNDEIEESILDIDEESKLIDRVSRLEKEKQSKFKKLSELEQGITEELENSEYFTLQNLIEDLEKQVEDVHNLLFQLSNERNSNHKEFLRLYRDIKGYEKLKKKIEKDFYKNIIFIERYKKIFKEANDYSKEKLFKEIYARLHPVEKSRKKKEISKKDKMIIEKKKLLKRLKDKKLKRVLDKRESGEKLDFYELKLIMDQEQKKKK